MDVLERTIERRLQQFNLQVRAQYLSVINTDLRAFALPLLQTLLIPS